MQVSQPIRGHWSPEWVYFRDLYGEINKKLRTFKFNHFLLYHGNIIKWHALALQVGQCLELMYETAKMQIIKQH